MENPRTTSARDHDDHDLIDDDVSTPSASGTSGGNLARDVASAGEASLMDPERHCRVTKQVGIDNDTARRRDRAR